MSEGGTLVADPPAHANDLEVRALAMKGAGVNGEQTERKGKKRPRRKKKKKKTKQPRLTPVKVEKEEDDEDAMAVEEVEYVSYQPQDQEDMAAFEAFKSIFDKFAAPEELCLSREEREQLEKKMQKESELEDGNENTDKEAKQEKEDESEEAKVSKREKKKMKRLSVALLKQLVARPEIVEVWDVTASDPALLVYLKSYRNTVPVPRHWCQKRKYLQGKRGVEKPAFELPEFIAATGITRIRQAIQEQEEQKKLKQKQRDKMAPKMGKMDIDYQVLHDAFFRYQTKPRMTRHGDLYYEGKEYEVKMKEKRPGILSDELKEALGMPENAPPPWLINMQRYGPPPSYINLKIPGLNAPIPHGAQFGYHPGGWGKPPVDQFGKPLYGDVFGTASADIGGEAGQPIERAHWGEVVEEEESEEEEEEEEEEEAEEEEEKEETLKGVEPGAAAMLEAGLVTPTGIVTPDHLVLRKKDVAAGAQPMAMEERPLYQVLPQKEVKVGSTAFGSSHVYVLGDQGAAAAGAGAGGVKKPKLEAVNLIKSQKTKEVDITLNPSELENLTDDMLKEKYEQRLAAQAQAQVKEDLSDLVVEHAKKKAKKEKEKKDKKYKDFKF